jgi:hypothetical protein
VCVSLEGISQGKKVGCNNTFSILVASSGNAALINFFSNSVTLPNGKIFETPLGYRTRRLPKRTIGAGWIRTYSELDDGREVLEFFSELLFESFPARGVRGEIDISGDGDALFPFDGAEDLGGKLSSSIGHGEGCGSSTVLGLDNFITTKLNSGCEGLEVRISEVSRERVRGLGEEWDNLGGSIEFGSVNEAWGSCTGLRLRRCVHR